MDLKSNVGMKPESDYFDSNFLESDTTMSKKIFILGHIPLLEDHPDYGKVKRHPGRWVLDQAIAVCRHTDFEVTVITLVKGASCDHMLTYNKVNIIYLKAQSRLRCWTLFTCDIIRLKNTIKNLTPSLLHVHGLEDAYGLAAYKLKIPKIITLQALYEDYNEKNPVATISAPKIIEYLERRVLNKTSQVIVKSRQFGNVVNQLYPKLDYTIIPNTITGTFLDPPVATKDPRRLAFVGTICERKGFHLVRQALELIDSTKNPMELHIYGEGGSDDYVHREISAIEATGHRFYRHGQVSPISLRKGLAAVNILVAPSYGETFGNQVIEALLCYCHCIVTENTGMAENIEKYGNGTIVSQRNAEDLAEAILHQTELGIGEDLFEERSRARTLVLDDLGPRKIASLLNDQYERLLNN